MLLLAASVMICGHWVPPVMVMNMSGFLAASVVIGSVTLGAAISTFSVMNSILSLLGDWANTWSRGGSPDHPRPANRQ